MPAETAATGSVRRGLIDTHHHISPPRFKAEARERIMAATQSYKPVLDWTLERAIEAMDENGIAVAMTSVTMAPFWTGDDEAARSLARSCNDYAAEIARDHPGRFGIFASLPLPDVEGSLREIAYAYDQLQADGIQMMTSYGGLWPSDPSFVPVFEELNRRSAIVHFHPLTPEACRNLIPVVSDTLLEFLFDTARAIVSLMFSGTFSRYPNIRFIFSHAGGALPPLVDRIERRVARTDELKRFVPDGTRATLARLYYDTASSPGATNLGALRSFVPASQILFGTDLPFVAPKVTTSGLPHLGFSEEALDGLYGGNALRLFPRLRSLPLQ